MPFKKTKSGKFKGPSGRTFTKKQVALYHASGGRFPSRKRPRRGKK